MDKVRKQDIMNIKEGEKKTFSLDTRKAIISAASYAWKLGRLRENENIERYTTKSDFRNMTITIKAVPYVRS